VDPSIRAILLQNSLAVLAELAVARYGQRAEEVQRAVFETLGSGRMRAIREAGPAQWLPLEYDLILAEAVEANLGPGADRERTFGCMQRSLHTTLLRPFVVGVEMVFGLEPASFLRQVPRGWHAVYREAGSMRYIVDGPSQRSLVLSGAPEALISSPIYGDSIAGALTAVLALAGVEGEVTAGERDLDTGTLVIRLRW